MKSKFFKILGVVAIVAMLASAIVAPVAANVSTPTLGVSVNTISAGSAYTVTFTTGVNQPTSTTAFTFTFDSGINVAGATATFAAMPSFTSIAVVTTASDVTISGQVITINTSTNSHGTVNQAYGAGTQIQVVFSGIINPAAIGNYGVTVASAAESTGVYSNTFTTTAPTTPVTAGVASVYNSAGILMSASNSLTTALGAVLSGGKITLTAGTYNTAFGTTATSCTIQGVVGSASSVILLSTGPWTLSGATVVIDSVTIDNTNGALTMNNATSGTVSNCIFKNATGNALVFSGAGTNTASADTFAVKNGATGISASAANTVTGCTFTVTGTGWGISSSAKLTASGCTFTGVAATAPTYTGQGIILSGGAASVIGTSTFTGLSTALDTTAGGVNFKGNTVTSCGMTTPTGVDAIMVHTVTVATAVVNVTNNKISSSLEYIISVAGNDNLVTVMDNQFATNVKNASNTGGVGNLNVTHNSWGATAPASTSSVDYSNPLGSVPTSSNFATGVSGMTLNATATAGVNVTASTGATTIGAAALTGNPVTPTIASTNTVVKYFDVFGIGTTGATIDFYGTTASPVTANSQIYFYNTTFGTWQACSAQTINTYGNYVEVTIGAGTAPTATQFSGLPFALVTVPPVLPGLPVTPSVLAPVNGAVNVPISNLTFTWPAVAGAGVTYQFALAQASANTSAAQFAILDYSDNTATNAEPSQEILQYNTVYWWEVRAVTMNSSGGIAATGPWTVSMFTTALAPVTTTGTGAVTTVVTSVVITNPVTTVVSTQTSVVITQATGTSGPAIPSYLLWAVIAVGAVLIIAVIVLIVRTRRIP